MYIFFHSLVYHFSVDLLVPLHKSTENAVAATLVSDSCRTLDKREYLMIMKARFCKFCIKTYVVTPHLNCVVETVQMRGHNIWFQ